MRALSGPVEGACEPLTVFPLLSSPPDPNVLSWRLFGAGVESEVSGGKAVQPGPSSQPSLSQGSN